MRHTTLSYCCLLLAAAAFMAGCEKHPVPKEQPLYDVSVSGELAIGEPLTFKSSAPSNSVFWWRFGDGNESLQQSPTYTFYSTASDGAAIADDTVVLIINNNIYRPNLKTFRLKPPVNKVNGTHVWRGGKFTLHGNCCAGLTDHPLNDTTFGITIVDENTIRVWDINLPFLADSNYFSNERKVGRYNAVTTTYTKDTIFFMMRSGTDTGWIEERWHHKF